MVQAGKIKQGQFVEAEEGETDSKGQVTLIFGADNVDMVFRVTILNQSGLEVIKLEYSLRLKIKCNDWLLADTCPQSAKNWA